MHLDGWGLSKDKNSNAPALAKTRILIIYGQLAQKPHF